MKLNALIDLKNPEKKLKYASNYNLFNYYIASVGVKFYYKRFRGAIFTGFSKVIYTLILDNNNNALKVYRLRIIFIKVI